MTADTPDPRPDWSTMTDDERMARAHPDPRPVSPPSGFAAHDLTEFPKRGTFAEVRMIYCRRCGASQPVESKAREPLPPCPYPLAAARAAPQADAGLREAAQRLSDACDDQVTGRVMGAFSEPGWVTFYSALRNLRAALGAAREKGEAG